MGPKVKEQKFLSWLFLHLQKTENVYGIFIKTDHILHNKRQRAIMQMMFLDQKLYFFLWKWFLVCSAASALPGNSLEMQTIRSCPKPAEL